MRFGHMADLHLGRIYHGVQLLEDQAPLMDQSAEIILDSKLDILLLTGDIYDRAIPPREAVDLFSEFLRRIIMDGKIRVLVLAGNHDGPERLGFCSPLLREQGLFMSTRVTDAFSPIPIEDKHGVVYVYPVPYVEPPLVRDALGDENLRDHEMAMAAMVAKICETKPVGARSVLAGHAFVSGGTTSESERPLSIGGLGTVPANIFSPFNYVAMGHLHRAQALSGGIGDYSGSIAKYSFSEVGQDKGINILDMDGAGEVTKERHILTPRRDLRIVEGEFDQILAAAPKDAAREDYLMIRLQDDAPVIDAMGRLREVYPNILHLERKIMNRALRDGRTGVDHKSLNDVALFEAFFKEATGDEITAPLKDAFLDVREEVKKAEVAK